MSDQPRADEEDEEPQPVKRARRISHILDGEEGWEEAYAASQPSGKPMRKPPERESCYWAKSFCPTTQILLGVSRY